MTNTINELPAIKITRAPRKAVTRLYNTRRQLTAFALRQGFIDIKSYCTSNMDITINLSYVHKTKKYVLEIVYNNKNKSITEYFNHHKEATAYRRDFVDSNTKTKVTKHGRLTALALKHGMPDIVRVQNPRVTIEWNAPTKTYIVLIVARQAIGEAIRYSSHHYKLINARRNALRASKHKDFVCDTCSQTAKY